MISILSGYSSDASWIAGGIIYPLGSFLLLLFYWQILKEIWQEVKDYHLRSNRRIRKVEKDKIWTKLEKKSWLKSLFIILIIFIVSAEITFLYQHGYDVYIGPASKEHLFEEALSNIYRNKLLLGFAIFGTCLAAWARWANEKQLQYTREQLENSNKVNRNDRFAKAVELIDGNSGIIATRGGLHMLRDLASESPSTEYIRCIEIISHWLIEDEQESQGEESKEVNKVVKDNLLDIALGIFRIKIDTKLELGKMIEKYKEINDWDFWPILQGANLNMAYLREVNLQASNLQGAKLQGAKLQDAYLKKANLMGAYLQGAYLRNANLEYAYLRNANLEEALLQFANLQNARLDFAVLENAILIYADLQLAKLQYANLTSANLSSANLQRANMRQANLENADLSGAKMMGARYLTKEQILSAKWFAKPQSRRGIRIRRRISGIPPELPVKLVNDPDVKKWLKKPAPDEENDYMSLRRKRFLKETAAKKAAAKKARAKKAIVKKPKN